MKTRTLFSFVAISIILVSLLVNIPLAHSNTNNGYSAFIASFESLANSYPWLATYVTVGKTVDNNDIIMFKIGNSAGGRVLFDGAIHGLEIGGSQILYKYAAWLLMSDDPLAKQILACDYTLLIPVVNVDSFNYTRVNAHGVDLNRNFATNWNSSGSTSTTSPNYHGPSPLSEPESQTLVNVFKTFDPQIYVNLHTGGSQYYLGSTYGNSSNYTSITNKINSTSKAEGIAPYNFYYTSGPGFAISDDARLGITSFLLELTNSGETQFTSQAEENATFQKFLPIAEVLSQQCQNEENFADSFESGSFSAWSGTYVTTGGTATIVNTFTRLGNYSAEFTSNGTNAYQEAYCYKSEPASSILYASGYFCVSQSGIVQNDDHFYLITFTANNNSVAYAGWQRTGGADLWNLMILNGSGWVGAYSTFSPSLDAWQHVQLYWTEGAANGTAKLYVSGVLACSIQNLNTTTYGGVDQVRFGLPEACCTGSTTVCAESCSISTDPPPVDPPWDINQDGVVNLQDLILLAVAYGSKPSSSKWNPAADINGDGKVDLQDLVILVSHYGQRYS